MTRNGSAQGTTASTEKLESCRYSDIDLTTDGYCQIDCRMKPDPLDRRHPFDSSTPLKKLLHCLLQDSFHGFDSGDPNTSVGKGLCQVWEAGARRYAHGLLRSRMLHMRSDTALYEWKRYDHRLLEDGRFLWRPWRIKQKNLAHLQEA